MLPRLTSPPASEGGGEGAEALEDYDGTDAVGYLSKAGLKPILAKVLVSDPGKCKCLPYQFGLQ
jgi:hypothetical protein